MASAFHTVSRLPARHTAIMSSSITSVSETSFFTSGAWAMKLGSSANASVAAMAATVPPSRHDHHAIATPSATPTISIIARLRMTIASPSLPAVR
jgi:hypothetical protein